MDLDFFVIFFIIFIVYIVILFIVKKIAWGKKQTCENCNNCCPDCQDALNRVERKSSDHFLFHITFRIFDFRRYHCSNCGWAGLIWEERFHRAKKLTANFMQ
jgi:hypothetical protein